MKKFILTFIAVCCCLFMMGCVSVPEKTVTFTVPDENVKIFTPKNLDAFFARYHFSAAHTPNRSWYDIYSGVTYKLPWHYVWERGNLKWYIKAHIHGMTPNELTFTGYEFDGSQFNEIISDFSSFLSSEKVKFQIGIQSRNLKEISISLRNQWAREQKASEIKYFKREKTGGEK